MQIVELDLGTVHADYRETWDLQRAVHADVADGTRPDTVLLCEHASVYTAGRRTAIADRGSSSSRAYRTARPSRGRWSTLTVGWRTSRVPTHCSFTRVRACLQSRT